MVRNGLGQSMRRRAARLEREREVAKPEVQPSTAETVARASMQRALMDHVLGLDEVYREVVLLRYFEGLKPGAIAERLEMPPASVKTWLRRALIQLRERLDREYGGDGRTWLAALTPFCTQTQGSAGGLLASSGVFLLGIKLVAALSVAAVAAEVYPWVPDPRDPRGERRCDRVIGQREGSEAVFRHIQVGLRLQVRMVESGTALAVEKSLPGPTFPGESIDVTLRMVGDRHRIRGRLLDPAGRPVVRKRIGFQFDTAEPADVTVASGPGTDSEGRFTIQLVSPRSSLTLRGAEIRSDGSEGAELHVVLGSLETRLGETLELGDLQAGLLPLVASGQAVDDKGQPLYWAAVRVQQKVDLLGYPLDSSETDSPQDFLWYWVSDFLVQTDHQGRFEVRGQSPSPHPSFIASKTGYLDSHRVEFVPGTRDITLVLSAEGLLEGSLRLNGLGPGQQGRGKRVGRGCGQGQGTGKGKGKGQTRGRRDPGSCGQASPGQAQGRRASNSTCCGGRPGLAWSPGARGGAVVSATPTVSLDYLRRLQATLEEELFARDFYAAAARATGMQRHRNLARAEEQHAQAIATAIESLGGQAIREHGRELPDGSDPAQDDRVCRAIERRVIEVYKGLIEDRPDPDLLPILRNIQAANHRHLQAVGG